MMILGRPLRFHRPGSETNAAVERRLFHAIAVGVTPVRNRSTRRLKTHGPPAQHPRRRRTRSGIPVSVRMLPGRIAVDNGLVRRELRLPFADWCRSVNRAGRGFSPRLRPCRLHRSHRPGVGVVCAARIVGPRSIRQSCCPSRLYASRIHRRCRPPCELSLAFDGSHFRTISYRPSPSRSPTEASLAL